MKKIKCLIIDDDKKIRNSIIDLIMEFYPDWETHQAEDGQAGINLINDNSFDLIVTDYEMKPKNGLDVLEHIFMNKYDASTIMITSHSNHTTWKGSIKFRVAGFLEKPFDPTQLLELFNTVSFEIQEKKKMKVMEELGKNSAMIIHDIKNPLTVMLGSSFLIKNKSEDQDLLKFADKIDQQSHTILDIINNVQTNIKNNALDAQDDNTTNSKELELLLKEFVSYKCPSLNFKINLSTELIPMNKVQIYQVLTNLINNSIDAISDIQDQWVTVSLSDQDVYFKIDVTDSGSGIPESEVPKLFNKLYSKKKKEIGTGLGLPIVKDLLEKSNASIHYNPHSKNTQFVIVLPKHS